jgi:hypothetical protein
MTMSDWMACYEVPRTCSWRKGSSGQIVIARPDGNVELMSSDEFDAKYVLRRPAPGELRDDLRKCEAEIERLRAQNQRILAHVATIDHLMDGPVQYPTTTIVAEIRKLAKEATP